MKLAKYGVAGILFGIVLVKSQMASWYRWQEAFRIDGFFFYGMFFTCLVVGIPAVLVIKKFKLNDFTGLPITFSPKNVNLKGNLFGGLLFGLGFALVGCPGSQYSHLGFHYVSVAIVIVSALAGTFLYGLVHRFIQK